MDINSLGIALQEVSMKFIDDDSDEVVLIVQLKGSHKRVMRLVEWLGEFCEDECAGLDGTHAPE